MHLRGLMGRTDMDSSIIIIEYGNHSNYNVQWEERGRKSRNA